MNQASLDSLLGMGALREATGDDRLCSAPNVDRAALEAYVRKAVAKFVPPLAELELVPGTPLIPPLLKGYQLQREPL